MTKDEIIEMARRASFRYTGNFSVDKGESLSCFQADLEAFAKLVADKEREACAKLCEEMSNTQANMNAAWRNGCRDAANEIRARGQA